MNRVKISKVKLRRLLLLVILLLVLIPMSNTDIKQYLYHRIFPNPHYNIKVNDIPDYKDDDYIVINNNEPYFNKDEVNTKNREEYSDLDVLGRSGVAIANISINTMPTKERGSIGQIKPTGWHTIKYDIINDKYLYNRCHLIGYQLTGQNANEKNLITCTNHMNKGPMLDIENKVAEYIKKTNNHVLYRVTPIFKDADLLSRGVQIEAKSVEDNGLGIKYNVFIYNIEKGININYTNGESSLK